MNTKRILRIATCFSLLMISGGMNTSLASSDGNSSERWSELFPRVVAMDIGGVSRVLVREIQNPDCAPPESEDNPLNYVVHKKTGNQYRLNESTHELVFSPQEKGWFREGQKMRLKDFSPFREGMRYIWTRGFRLLSSTNGNHAQIDNGDYALCVGTLHFDDSGLICRIDNATGHMCSEMIQVFHMVTDLARMGAIAPYCKIMNYKGQYVSPAELSAYEPNPDMDVKLVTVTTPLEVIDAHKNRFSHSVEEQGVSILDTQPCHAQMVFDVLHHEGLEISANGGRAGIGPRNEELLAKLMSSRPHGELYEMILSIRDHSIAIDLQIACVARGGNAMHESYMSIDEAKKKAAYDRLEDMLNKRPYPKLYDAILGKPEMPAYE